MTLFDFWNEWEVLHRQHVVNHDVKIISRSDSIQEESHQGSSFKMRRHFDPTPHILN